ncbi:MAG: type VI secretion system membrane subunit TssM [Gammaproteobacteria bacterium]|nr:type VI secretion system membrane subunit TssM [Gammaproteobacteria bacterium]
MRRIFSFFTQTWLLALIGIILFSLIIWYIGPLVAIADYKPLESETVRLLLVFVVFIIWGLNNLRRKKSDEKSDKKIASNLIEDAKSSPDKNSQAAKEKSPDEEMLSKRLSDAITTLQQSQFGKKGKLYKLPWYMIIGAPGSGKTTALKNSGLQFPLRSKLGEEPVQGAGGTRYCDWWFTDEAILIDTAGRYTTQDNPKKIENHSWIGFLEKLKKLRPKRPLNGIILTISISDLLQKTGTQKAIQTTAIKQRIQELNSHLGMELPVYVLFTKTDVVAGFSSFFADLEKEEQQQVWGITFPYKRATDNNNLLEKFNTEYMMLMERINNRVLNRLNHEKNAQQRTLIYEFPHQMSALKQPLYEFLYNIFTPNQFEDPFLFRGVYFISGTQTNMAAQWVTGVLQNDQRTPPTHIAIKEPKTFFVTRLLKDIIFSEANMATINTKEKSRHRWTYRITFAVTICIFAGGVFAWNNSKNINEDYIAQLDKQIKKYAEVTGGNLDGNQNWSSLAAGLNQLKSLRTGYDEGSEDYLFQQGLGLYQGHKLGSQAYTTYLKALEMFFMTDLAELLTAELDFAEKEDDHLYEALKSYLMLYTPEKMDTEIFAIWVNILWNRALPGEFNQEIRDHLNVHLATALQENILPPAIDQARVDKSREILMSTSQDSRIYRRLKNEYNQKHKEQYTVSQVLGKKADIMFYRRSGKPLTEGIPELFTYKGFHTGFNIQNKKLAKRLTDEQWIYGDTVTEKLSQDQVEKISERVNEYYFNEYTLHWRNLIKDLAVKPFNTVNQGQAVVRLFASSEEPLITLLNSIRKNTALGEVPAVSESTKALLDTVTEEIVSDEKSRLERILPKSSGSSSIKLPGYVVSENFDSFNDYANNSEGLPLHQLQSSLNALDEYFQTLADAGNLKQAAFQANLNSEAGSNALTTVNRSIAEAPPEIRRWFGSIAKNTNKITATASQGHINNLWQTEVMDFYNTALKGRYPIDASSEREIKMDDFTAFFGPAGIIDNYFKNYIEPFVDSSQGAWKWKKNIGLSDQSLRFFERARRIKRAYFNAAEGGPQVKFTLKPRSLDTAATAILLETANVSFKYSHGPIKSTRISWPSAESETDSSTISFTLASRGTPVSVTTQGEWSWFRLLDNHAKKTATKNSDSLLVTFTLSGIDATYELKPQSTYNPFDNQDIKNFNLPTQL